MTGALVGGVNLSVEFNIGTLTKVQLEQGANATVFEIRNISQELMLCSRYAQPQNVSVRITAAAAGSSLQASGNFSVSMRANPTAVVLTAAATINVTALNFITINNSGFRFETTAVAAGDAYALSGVYLLTAEL